MAAARMPVAGRMRIRIGLAGWNNPPQQRTARRAGQTHLSYYAAQFPSVEINSSFYKSHRAQTYRRWRDETPAGFRFAVKMPRSITHEAQLKGCRSELKTFFAAVASLWPKLAVLLVQLPPSLVFNRGTVRRFFALVPRLRGVRLVCEPRHASWFTPAADATLRELRVSRVAADPVQHPDADTPGGDTRCAYFRWHGSPHRYYSSYSPARLQAFAQSVERVRASQVWCVFDNTARHAAWGDALGLKRLLGARCQG